MAMFGYMTDIETVEATSVQRITATGYYSNSVTKQSLMCIQVKTWNRCCFTF